MIFCFTYFSLSKVSTALKKLQCSAVFERQHLSFPHRIRFWFPVQFCITNPSPKREKGEKPCNMSFTALLLVSSKFWQ